MPRKTSPTQELAYRFVSEILGESFDYRLHSRQMAEAKRYVNPPEDKDVEPLPLEDVWGCILAIKNGVFDYDEKILTLHVITFGTPPYIQQYYQWKKEPPPFYLTDQVRLWESITGQKVPAANPVARYVPTL